MDTISAFSGGVDATFSVWRNHEQRNNIEIPKIKYLYNLKSIAGTYIIGSSGPHDQLIIPWGSNPITDYLLENFSIIHDGATHNRIEKVHEIAQWETGIKNLRVCWQGSLKDRNCGKCEKCIRTKLNFLLFGHPIPECFPDRDEKINFRSIN